jgi:hypothetical protein
LRCQEVGPLEHQELRINLSQKIKNAQFLSLINRSITAEVAAVEGKKGWESGRQA